jgi:hypothetical protein
LVREAKGMRSLIFITILGGAVAETLSVARVGFCNALVMFLIQLEAYKYVLALPTLSICLEETNFHLLGTADHWQIGAVQDGLRV